MIGSPALRGAVVSVGGAGRAGLAAASGLNAVSAAIAARVKMAGGPQRRIATVGCIVVNFAPKESAGFRDNRLIYDSLRGRKGSPQLRWGPSGVRSIYCF